MDPRFVARAQQGQPLPEEPLTGRPYWGATEDELLRAPGGLRLLALSDQRRLFPHDGHVELLPDAIVLRGWRVIERPQVTGVALTFTSAYSRWMAGGVRAGNAASLGILGGLGKPLVISVAGRSPVYLLLDFNWFWGTNRNRRWYPTITSWLNGPTPAAATHHPREGR
jgi:hypothetical protein